MFIIYDVFKLRHFFNIFSVHVVFGHVISGQDIITIIENQKVDASSRPLSDVKIANCGELVPKMKPKG